MEVTSYLTPLCLDDSVKAHLIQNYSPVKHDGDNRFKNLLSRLGCPPLFTTLRVNILKSEVSDVIDVLKKQLQKNYDRKGLLLPKVYKHPRLDDVIVIENQGPITREKTNKEVIVDLSCGMAVLRGADVFVQGIIGSPPDMKADDKVTVYADINGKCLRGLIKPFDGEKLFVGNGVVQFNREDIYCSKEPLSGVGVLMTEPLYEGPSLSGICVDMIFPQNLPSIVCSHVLDPQPGEIILDMCAAPGGKTTHLAVLMKNKGRLIAVDKTPQKIQKIQQHAKQWELNIIETYAYDSTQLVDDSADVCGGPPYPPESFDRILLDGPCSALGQRPSARNKMSLNSLKSYPTYQKKLLRAAVRMLKPNGILVYSTCTISQEENEKQVMWTMKTFPEMSLESQEPHLGQIGQTCEGLTEDEQHKLQFFDPGHIVEHLTVDNDTIGFFIAKFRKK